MREWPMECKDAFHRPFAFFCSGRIIRSKGKGGTSGISTIRRAGRAMRVRWAHHRAHTRIQRLHLRHPLRRLPCLRSEPSTGPNVTNAATVRPNSTPNLKCFDGWPQTTGRWGSAPSAPNAAPIFSYAISAGASGTHGSLIPPDMSAEPMTAVPSMTGMTAGWCVTARRGVLIIGTSNAMNVTSMKAATQTRLNTMAGGLENALFAPNAQSNPRKERTPDGY